MPHINDRTDFNTAAGLFAIPRAHLVRKWTHGKLCLDDVPEEQAKFNGMVFQNVVSPQASLPWDRGIGRTFTDLVSYFNWISPENDRYLINVSVASRVVSYLLPYTGHDASGNTVVSGFPGLRLREVRRHSYVLQHLPTGGLLEISDSAGGPTQNPIVRDLSELEYEMDVSRDAPSAGWTPVWSTRERVPGEMRLFDALMQPSKLLSSLAARADLLLRIGQRVELIRRHRAPSSLGKLVWYEVDTRLADKVPDVMDLLTGKHLGIPGAEAVVGAGGERFLKLGDESIGIHDPRYIRPALRRLIQKNSTEQ
ncbi:hypothetical protein AOZ07_01595 [Glutamicibacter halophytocola]|nr:hypothetical protein AOZ07_01595 [Glutamicibacter halophytocola]